MLESSCAGPLDPELNAKMQETFIAFPQRNNKFSRLKQGVHHAQVRHLHLSVLRKLG